MKFKKYEDNDYFFLERTRKLVDEVIDDRLIRSGLHLKPRNKVISDLLQQPGKTSSYQRQLTVKEKLKILKDKRTSNRIEFDDLLMTFLYIGECLESKYQYIYTDVFQHLNIKKLIETEMRKKFLHVAEEIFKKDITWAKIISLIVFSGGLTVDCVLSGNSIYISRVKNWCVEFIDSSLKEWIVKNGGWFGFFDQFVLSQRSHLVKKIIYKMWICAIPVTAISLIAVACRTLQII
nr:bcl-2-related ovarian killer protein homolog B [Hydra vulgaris]